MNAPYRYTADDRGQLNFEDGYSAFQELLAEEGEGVLSEWMRNAAVDAPEIAIGIVGILQRYLAEREEALVPQLRAGGFSWQWIADHLGRSRQSVWQKYRTLDDPDAPTSFKVRRDPPAPVEGPTSFKVRRGGQ